MNHTITKAKAAVGIVTLCLAACNLAHAQTPAPTKPAPTPAQTTAPAAAQPTGTSGATAFQPAGSARGEVEAGSAQHGNAGMHTPAKPGFDNKPPRGAKADCHRPQGGVDASGGENISTASKDNTTCTGKKTKPNK